MTNCIKCGKEFTIEGRSDRLKCDACKKEEADTFYAYSELRFEVWQFLRNHGPAKTRDEVYNKMVDEEGVDWALDVLGKELVDAILEKVE